MVLNNNSTVMTNRDSKESVIVKGVIPRNLKLQFKVLCIQKELRMSTVLEDLLRKWIQADSPVSELLLDPAEDAEYVKGYIPKSLKLQFKVLCTMRGVKMCSIMYALINEWVQAGGPDYF